MEKTYEIPRWILKDIDNTFRMTSNIYEPTQEESMSYYSTPGLLPPELKP